MKTTDLIGPSVGLLMSLFVMFSIGLKANDNSPELTNWDNSYLKIIQLLEVNFADMPDTWCKTETLVLPTTDDDGVTGVWSPTNNIDVNNFGGQTITVIFTPDDTNYDPKAFDILIESPAYLGIEQTEPLMFCKTGGDIFVDLVDTLDLQLTNIMTLQGDGQLFGFIEENSFNPSTFETELRTLNLKDIPSGPYTFFVESSATNSCEFTTQSFSLEVLDLKGGIDDTLNICMDNPYFHNFDQMIQANGQGTWQERSGSTSGLNLSSPTSMDLSQLPIGKYTFDYTVVGVGACSGRTNVTALEINVIDNASMTLAEPTTMLCGISSTMQVPITFGGSSPYTLVVQLEDENGNLFPSYNTTSSSDILNLEVVYTTGINRIKDDTIYLNSTSSFYTLRPVDLADANSQNCFDQILTGSTRIDLDFAVVNIEENLCESEEFIFNGEVFNASRKSGSVLKTGICDTTFNISINFIDPPVIKVTDFICENESIILYGEEFSASRLQGDIRVSYANTCDTIYEVEVQLYDRGVGFESYEFCPGESIEIGNQVFDISNATGSVVLPGENGCDSIVNVNITAREPLYSEISNLDCEGNLTMTLCPGDSVVVENEIFHMGRPSGVVNLVSFDGCDSIITVDLIYSSPVSENISQTICSNDSIVVGSTTFNQNNPQGSVTLTGSNGCDSIVNVDLTILSPTSSTISEPLCSGEELMIGGQVFDSSTPSGEVVLTNGQGCDSIITVDLTIVEIADTEVTESICDGTSKDFGNGVVLDASNTTETITYQSALGCDSVVTYTVDILTSYNINRIETLCDNESIIVGVTTYDINNPSGTVNMITAEGCDSIVNVDLTFLNTSETTIQDSYCDDQDIVVGGETFNLTNPSGAVVLTNAAGCDSTVTVDLTFGQVIEVNLSESICVGGQFDFGDGVILDENNLNQSEMYVSALGCDSIVNYSITVNQPTTSEFNTTICPGENIVIQGIAYHSARTTGQAFYTNAAGCDSIVNITVGFFPTAVSSVSRTLCEGESFTILNKTITSNFSGRMTFIGGSENGCDSIVDISVNFRSEMQGPDYNDVICRGEEVTIEGEVFNENRLTGQVWKRSDTTCDTLYNVNLTLFDDTPVDINSTICRGTSVEIMGTTFDENHLSETFTLMSSSGCDSLVNVNVTLEDDISSTMETSVCKGGSIQVLGETFDANHLSEAIVLSTAEGCDSTVFVTVTLLEDITSNINETICKGGSIEILGEIFDANHLSDAIVLSTDSGCDSTVFVTVTEEEDITSTLEASVCVGGSIEILGQTFDANRLSDAIMLSTANGCDSIVFVSVTVEEDITSTMNASVCKGGSIEILGQTFDANRLSDAIVLSTSSGCDSTVYVTVTEDEELSSTIEETVCFGESINILGQNFDRNHLTDVIPFTTALGCDSVVYVTVVEEAEITSTMEASVCKGGFINIHGIIFDQDNLNQPILLQTADGCDSTIFVTVTLQQDIASDYNETICQGDFLDIGDQRFHADNMSGQVVLSTAEGCDSTVNVNLEIAPTYWIEVDTSICASQYGTGVNSAAMLSDTIEMVTSLGCDSIYVVNIQLLESVSSIYEETLCPDEFVTIGNETFDINNPIGSTVLTSAIGCDSIVNVNLTFRTVSETTLTTDLCEGEEIVINGNSYDIDNPIGFEVITLPNGCDSLITLDLRFREIGRTTFDEEYCYEDVVTINGVDYTRDSPSGTHMLTSANGCDSIITVDLTFHESSSREINENLCLGEELTIGGRNFNYSNPAGVVNLVNAQGCDSVINIDLRYTNINADIRGRAVCPEDPSGGIITIAEVTAGMAPYSYVLNGEPSVIINEYPYVISNLSPANHSIEIIDAEGCSMDQLVTVSEGASFEIKIEYEETGEGEYDLTLRHNGEIDSLYWVTDFLVSCADCSRPSIVIDETTIVKVVVIDLNGCERTDEVKIEYQRGIQIETPNILNLSSTVNNLFYPTVVDPTDLTYDLYIYSRWGEVVYSRMDNLPNDKAYGWDGTRAGRKLDTGVYIYEIMIKENNELLDVVHGDVTVID